jgi:DNA polymerase-3 subunit alpha
LQLVLVDLAPEQAADIAVQHRLRECLHRHRPAQDEVGVRVLVLACLREGDRQLFVRLGPQFCVADATAAVATLTSADFSARLRSPIGAEAA